VGSRIYVRVKLKSSKKSSSRMFGAFMKIVGAAKLVRVHAKLAGNDPRTNKSGAFIDEK
jgi:hypothetical protein